MCFFFPIVLQKYGHGSSGNFEFNITLALPVPFAMCRHEAEFYSVIPLLPVTKFLHPSTSAKHLILLHVFNTVFV